jgi:hypothetical protein
MQDQKDCLQAELKMMREDLHKIMLELTERIKRASKLQAKYETQCSKRIGVEGADEARSQVKGISFAFLVIFHSFHEVKLHAEWRVQREV